MRIQLRKELETLDKMSNYLYYRIAKIFMEDQAEISKLIDQLKEQLERVSIEIKKDGSNVDILKLLDIGRQIYMAHDKCAILKYYFDRDRKKIDTCEKEIDSIIKEIHSINDN